MTRSHGRRPPSRLVPFTSSLGLVLLVTGCASSFDKPPPIDEAPIRARAVTRTEEGIRVSAAVPSAEEARPIFGVDLEAQRIQPVWLEITNGMERPIALLPTGIDPEYFAPLEVAFLFDDVLNAKGRRALGEHLQARGFDHRSLIMPGETVSGFVYTNQAKPTMIVDVDLLGNRWSRSIALFVPVPGTEDAQERLAELGKLYTEADFVDLADEASLRAALEALPCCATDERAAAQGPPLNLILIGTLEEWGPAFVRRRYQYRIVPPLYAFGRAEDLSARKTSRWIEPQPHTLRAWLTPLRYRGKPIWLTQISSHLGGRFGVPDGDPMRIEPDLDEARNGVVQDLLYSQRLAKLGFVQGAGPGIEAGQRDAPGYRSDGLRAVMVFGSETVSLGEIEFFDWERLGDHEQRAARASAVP